MRKLDIVTYILYTIAGLTVGYNTAVENSPIIVALNFITLFMLGYAYKTYRLIKELEEWEID